MNDPQLKTEKRSQLIGMSPSTIGGSLGIGYSISVMVPGAYATFQNCFGNGVGWGIATLSLLGVVTGGIAQILVNRFGIRRNEQMPNFIATRLIGMVTGTAIMVGVGLATRVYKCISESTGWDVRSVPCLVVVTWLMFLGGWFAGHITQLLFKLPAKQLTE